MNTGFLGSAVATVLTVYGIETFLIIRIAPQVENPLQQYLPFTVLKPIVNNNTFNAIINSCNSTYRLRY